jgi:hypothetical protein
MLRQTVFSLYAYHCDIPALPALDGELLCLCSLSVYQFSDVNR